MLLNSKLMRFYSVSSFVIIFVTAAILTLFYRQITIQWILHIAETNNRAIAQTALDLIKPELVAYLRANTDTGTRKVSLNQFSNMPGEAIRTLAQVNSLERINIYNRKGQLAFSTKAGLIDINQTSYPFFIAALSGRDASSMIYRDTFNRFETASDSDNLMETYLPVRNSPNEPVLGVFEIHSDMSHLIQENNKHLLIFLIGAEFILALLYAVLILVVRHAKKIIDLQQHIIQDRTATLEVLSNRLLHNEEQHKQKIAYDLQEGLAQTLSAIKFNVEFSNSRINAPDANKAPLKAVIPVIQNAIQEVRTIATNLRPSSLDELGLLPTINWFCREFEQFHEEIIVEREISIAEAAIPVQLKIVIYRIIESTFKNIADHSNTDQIGLTLQQTGNKIVLRIGDTPIQQSLLLDTAKVNSASGQKFRFAEMKERTLLSGGIFSSRFNAGWVTLKASWIC